MSADDDVTALVRSLNRYLRDNPLACDSADGIARWWLAAPPDPGTLDAALVRMAREGEIQALRAADGRVRYRRRAAEPPPPAAGAAAGTALPSASPGPAPDGSTPPSHHHRSRPCQ
jgi:hypothetical protein